MPGIKRQNDCLSTSPDSTMKLSRLLLFGLIGTCLTLSSDRACSQLNVQFQKQQSKKRLCELDWWPDAQYEYKQLSPESRILVKDDNVFRISFKNECKSEFIGYINRDYNYSPNKTTHFTPATDELIEYYKNPNNSTVRKQSHAKRSQVNKKSRKRSDIRAER